MASNVSVERFKRLCQEMQQEVHDLAVAELNTQGDNLVRVMESVAPRREGVLEHSIKKVPGSSDTQIRVMAGGRETVREGVSSRPYDYSRADEFGTHKMAARPFFWPTYRLMKPKMVSTMKRRITAAIKKRSAE